MGALVLTHGGQPRLPSAGQRPCAAPPPTSRPSADHFPQPLGHNVLPPLLLLLPLRFWTNPPTRSPASWWTRRCPPCALRALFQLARAVVPPAAPYCAHSLARGVAHAWLCLASCALLCLAAGPVRCTQVLEWRERGVDIDCVRRTNRQGYKAGAMKEVGAAGAGGVARRMPHVCRLCAAALHACFRGSGTGPACWAEQAGALRRHPRTCGSSVSFALASQSPTAVVCAARAACAGHGAAARLRLRGRV